MFKNQSQKYGQKWSWQHCWCLTKNFDRKLKEKNVVFFQGKKGKDKPKPKTGLENVTLLLAGAIGQGMKPSLLVFDLRELKVIPESFIEVISNEKVTVFPFCSDL